MTEPAPDPGNAGPGAWSQPLSDDELTGVLAALGDPDPLVTAGLAGTLGPDHGSGPAGGA